MMSSNEIRIVGAAGSGGGGGGGGYEPGGVDVAVADGGTGASNAAGARTNLGLVIGADVQAQDAELEAIAGLTSAADMVPYFTGSGAAALATFTSSARTLLAAASAAAQRTALGLVIGTDVQAQDPELQAVAGLTSAADRLPYFTGSGTAALATFTSAARTLVAAVDDVAQRTALGLGTIATQAASAVAITGGTLAGVTISTSKFRPALNTQTGTTYTLALTDESKIVETNNVAANSVTVPTNATVAFPVGSRIDITQYGTGLTTIVPAVGVTIASLNGLKSQGRYSGITLYKRATDEWVAIGALTT